MDEASDVQPFPVEKTENLDSSESLNSLEKQLLEIINSVEASFESEIELHADGSDLQFDTPKDSPTAPSASAEEEKSEISLLVNSDEASKLLQNCVAEPNETIESKDETKEKCKEAGFKRRIQLNRNNFKFAEVFPCNMLEDSIVPNRDAIFDTSTPVKNNDPDTAVVRASLADGTLEAAKHNNFFEDHNLNPKSLSNNEFFVIDDPVIIQHKEFFEHHSPKIQNGGLSLISDPCKIQYNEGGDEKIIYEERDHFLGNHSNAFKNEGHGDSLGNFSSALPANIREPSRKCDNHFMDENKSQRHQEVEPFISNNPSENQDNQDPEWEVIKKLKTDKGRYKAVRRLWKNLGVPNPNKDLTHMSYRRRHLIKIKPNEASRKRKRTSNRDPIQPPSKRLRTRTVPCTKIVDKKMYQEEAESAAKRSTLVNEFRDRVRTLAAKHVEAKQRMKIDELNRLNQMETMDPRSYTDAYWRILYSRLNLEDQQAKELETEYRKHFTKLCTEETTHRSAMRKLEEVRKEMFSVNKYYRGLERGQDPTFLDYNQMREIEEIDHMYKQYSNFYCTKAAFLLKGNAN